MEKESHYQYLQALNENIGVAILSYLEDGTLQLVNPAAKALFNKPVLNKIDDIKSLSPIIYEVINKLSKGGNETVQTKIGGIEHELSITGRQFILEKEASHVVLIQDIKSALDHKESESWQKLVRVLTHEIMNSVTPIVSLSKAVNSSMQSQNISDLTEEDKDDLLMSIQTIENRGKGMVKFVNAYKDYARDIVLAYEEVDIGDLTRGVQSLFRPIFIEKNITLTISVKPSVISVEIDKGLIEQVLINLVKNAIEALDSGGTIDISISKKEQSCQINVADSGSGISHDVLRNIFVSFFTTKRKGSGVGLSISRKVLQLHNGSIKVNSSEKGTRFILSLPL